MFDPKWLQRLSKTATEFSHMTFYINPNGYGFEQDGYGVESNGYRCYLNQNGDGYGSQIPDAAVVAIYPETIVLVSGCTKCCQI